MALEHGTDDYIVKPFQYEVVMAKIKSHLRRIFGEYAPKVKERGYSDHDYNCIQKKWN